MVEIVYLNDGTAEIIGTNKADFLERLIRERLGDDASRCFTECISDLKEELKLTQESVNELERCADGYLQMCQNACEHFQEVLKFFDEPRLNRKALQTAVLNGYNDLYKNL